MEALTFGQVDPKLVEGWLRARSRVRGLPPPQWDRGGLRVDSGQPGETRRYVFAALTDGLAQLANEIVEARIALKACAPPCGMQRLLPPRWVLQPQSYFMVSAGPFDAATHDLARGYRIELTTDEARTTARVLAPGGGLAASGRAAAHDGVFIYDQIVTDPGHRRRGLGRAVMGALQSVRLNADPQVLTATEAGRALYAALGWTVQSPYTTALIPPARQA